MLSLLSIQWYCSFLYLDDIVIFSKLPVGRIGEVWRLVRPLYEAKVTQKLNKRKFSAQEIDYPCQVTLPERPGLADHAIETAAKLENTTTKIELPCFLGLCNMIRWFVPKFAVSPLTSVKH